MTKYLITIATALLIGISAPNIYAKKAKENLEVKTSKQQMMLYAKPNEKSDILDKMDMKECKKLVPIYRQNEWIKVGNSDNGQVGWINTKKCQELRDKMARTTIKSVVINVTDKIDENGKTEIIAYKNGEKLSDKEAQQLLKQLRSQEMDMRKHFINMEKEMNKMFDAWMKMWRIDDKDYNDNWIMAPKHMHHINDR